MSDRATLENQIRAVQFSMFDLRLFLDTHPRDPAALALYNKYKMKNAALIAEYERAFGPYEKDYDTGNMWQWVNNPWPWNHPTEV